MKGLFKKIPKGNKSWMKGFVLGPKLELIDLVEKDRIARAVERRKRGR